MDWARDLIIGSSAAQTVAVLSLVGALGLALGSIRIGGISLGIGGVLFSGLIAGHFGLSIDGHVMEFVREFGLILFVYTIGMQVGPGFLASLKRQGLPLNLMATAIVVLGAILTVIACRVGKVPAPVASGLFSGATTNTPSLAAAQQALKEQHGADSPAATQPALGYAVAYPFGILGIIITMLGTRSIFRIDPKAETAAYEQQQRRAHPGVMHRSLRVENPNLTGRTLEEAAAITGGRVVFSRLLRSGEVRLAQSGVTIEPGDVLLAIGPEKDLERLQVLVGSASDVDLKSLPSELSSERIVVSQRNPLGKAIAELGFEEQHGVVVTRIARGDVEFAANDALRLQPGDIVTAVGPAEGLAKVSKTLGNSQKQLNHPHIIPVFVGIALGVLLGSMPIAIPGIPAPLKLGLAGGPLLVALLLSQIGRIGPLVWYLPPSANFALREIGIVLFLACVGLKSGHGFLDLVTSANGLVWMAWGAAITLIPIAVVAIWARVVRRENFVSLCGLLAGSMTDPPALAFANTLTKSDAPSVSYASVYPLVMLLRVFLAQALVMVLA